MMMPRPCPSTSRLLKTFLKSYNFFIMEKCLVSEIFQVTLESGLDVGQGITVGPGKFVKKNKRRALNKRRA